jgi:hypothetical protein
MTDYGDRLLYAYLVPVADALAMFDRDDICEQCRAHTPVTDGCGACGEPVAWFVTVVDPLTEGEIRTWACASHGAELESAIRETGN